MCNAVSEWFNLSMCPPPPDCLSPQGLPPPERLMTRGAVGPYLLYPPLLEDLDLLKDLEVESSLLMSSAPIQSNL